MQMLAASSAVSGNVLGHKAQQRSSLLLEKVTSSGWEAERTDVPIATQGVNH